MKGNSTKTSQIEAVHSIEAILGIKNGEQHSTMVMPFSSQQFLLSSATYPTNHQGSTIENKKQENSTRRVSDETEILSNSKSNGNSDDELIDDDDDSDSHDQTIHHGGSNSKKKHRRNRTTFTTFQLHELERAFEKSRKNKTKQDKTNLKLKFCFI